MQSTVTFDCNLESKDSDNESNAKRKNCFK
jgi:hypothetical protein